MTQENAMILIIALTIMSLISGIALIVHFARKRSNRLSRQMQAQYREQIRQMQEKIELDQFTLKAYRAIICEYYKTMSREMYDD